MNRSILFFFLFVGCLSIQAQNAVEEVVRSIDQNNTTLKALKMQMEAAAIGNRTGIYPHGPELEYAYFWSTPRPIGPKQNVAFRQSFAFPTVYAHQNRIASTRNEQLVQQYSQQRIEILAEARLYCIDLTHANAMLSLAGERLDHAGRLMRAYDRMLELGETSLLEHNKVRVYLATATQQLRQLTIEREHLLAELRRMNGGLPVDFTATGFLFEPLPADFDQWYEEISMRHPMLRWVEQEAEVSRMQLALSRAPNLPEFSAGYVSETLAHEKFHGWSAGIAIPLWENKNTVKLARANVVAVEEAARDTGVQVYNQLKAIHQTASGLLQTRAAFAGSLEGSDHAQLLEKAFESGEINLISYLQELSYYYQSEDLLLQTDRDLARTLAQLFMVVMN